MTPLHTPAAKTALTILMAALLLASLPACGKKDEAKAATQVAAKVGSEEISVHQINQVLSRTNSAGATPEAVQALSRDVLEKLIDQQLAIDQAMQKDLHRTPDVVAQIEAAKREILARAYLQQLTSALPKPTAEDIKKYYTDHPALFAERRIFTVQEIVVPAAPGAADKLRTLATPGRAIEDIATDLKAQGVKFNTGSASRAAEQIPLELLGSVHPLKDGQSTFIDTPQTVTYLRLVSSQNAPVDEATATSRIAQFLANQRANDAVVANIKTLRTATTVTYMGNFANTPLEKGLAGLK